MTEHAKTTDHGAEVVTISSIPRANSGFVGDPYIFNGYEQNSQWLDPQTPLRQTSGALAALHGPSPLA